MRTNEGLDHERAYHIASKPSYSRNVRVGRDFEPLEPDQHPCSRTQRSRSTWTIEYDERADHQNLLLRKKNSNLTGGVLADSFSFTSPNDDHISKSVFKERCFSSQLEFIERFELETVPARGNEAFVTLDDLKLRLQCARLPDRETVRDWSQRIPLDKLRALIQYWRTSYDWKRCEVTLNRFSQFRTETSRSRPSRNSSQLSACIPVGPSSTPNASERRAAESRAAQSQTRFKVLHDVEGCAP